VSCRASQTGREIMAFESTITEKNMDAGSQTLAQGIRGDNRDFEPDLSVDGLSDSILAKLLRLFRLA
ncbi:MAG: hypothetical protein OEV03_02890, partial [Gammaproteobacteria bacterium]|nr:hypothetical protein [Gammaproteobacteria bacterium]